jgi:CBS domain containing-hemolysin-like protein
MEIFIGSVTVALAVSFVCSLMEATLLSLTPGQVAELSTRHPGVGRIWHGFKANIRRPIAVILILNTAAHTIGAAVAGAYFAVLFGSEWIWVFSVLFTFAMLQYTEILAKTIGVYFNRRVALWIARPLHAATLLFTPLVHLTYLLNRPFERRREEAGPLNTMQEIASLAALARLSDHIGAHQERLISRATKLSHTRARQVMIPVEQVSMLSTSQTPQQALAAALVDGHTRFPVYEGEDRNRVTGYVNLKELVYRLQTIPADPSIKAIVHPVHFVSPESLAADLLKTFVDQHAHIVMVRDSEGRCLGLITLEDLIEELVGELQDEFDRLPSHVHSLGDGTWLFGGGVPMSEVAARLDGRPAGVTGSLAAWLEQLLGEPPRPGQLARYDGLEFTVRRIRRGRVFEATVAVRNPA